jgi:hypothetical protein
MDLSVCLVIWKVVASTMVTVSVSSTCVPGESEVKQERGKRVSERQASERQARERQESKREASKQERGKQARERQA